MGLLAINMIFKGRNPIVSETRRGRGYHLIEGSRGSTSHRAVVSASVASCVLCFFIGAVPNRAVYAEGKSGAAPTQKERRVAQPDAVSKVETTHVVLKHGLKPGREKRAPVQALDAQNHRSDAPKEAQGNPTQRPDSASAAGKDQ